MVQEHHSLTRLLATSTLAWLLAGCPSQAPRPEPDAPQSAATDVERPPIPGSMAPAPAQRPPPATRENHLSPATRSLVTQARSLTSHGDFDGASSTLERALRIEPNNPLLWVELGKVRLAENDAHQAEGCGRKALALASGDRATQKLAGHVVADALRAQQRNEEAHDIESQPYMR